MTSQAANLSAPAWIESVSRVIAHKKLDHAEVVQLVNLGLSRVSPSTAPQTLIAACEEALGGHIHYSQEGEDILLMRFLNGKRNGFFVDVGAHHAIRFSNTYALYRRGWRGVNIDATPSSMSSFELLRPEDTNIEAAVSDSPTRLTFHIFEEGALNTSDATLAASYMESGYALKEKVELTARPLAEILDECVPAGQHIDLMSVDVEGAELAVLRSNDWERFAPDLLIIEALDTPLTEIDQNPCVTFLFDKGYTPVSMLTNSIILRRRGMQCAAS